MDKQLDSYIKIYRNALPKDVCAATIRSLDASSWDTHSFYANKEIIRFDKEFNVTWDHIPEHKQIMDIFWQAIHTYIKEDLKMPWFGGWNGFSSVRFNKYSTNTEMREHCDHIHTVFDGDIKGIPIITVLCGLNDDYEGGELIFFGDTKYELKAGDIMVFPSSFLYPHKVQEVISGIRYSCVSWVY